MKAEIKLGDSVNVKVGESTLGHKVVSVGSTHAVVRRGEVSRRVPLEDISAPVEISGAAESDAPATSAAAHTASDAPTRAEFDALKKEWEQFAELAGRRLDVIETANAQISSLVERVQALEDKPASVAPAAPEAPAPDASAAPVTEKVDEFAGGTAK